jgi:hypothetical protein
MGQAWHLHFPTGLSCQSQRWGRIARSPTTRENKQTNKQKPSTNSWARPKIRPCISSNPRPPRKSLSPSHPSGNAIPTPCFAGFSAACLFLILAEAATLLGSPLPMNLPGEVCCVVWLCGIPWLWTARTTFHPRLMVSFSALCHIVPYLSRYKFYLKYMCILRNKPKFVF